MRSKIQDSGFKFLLNTEKFNDNVNVNDNMKLETWNMKRAEGAEEGQRYNGGVHGEWTRWKNLGKGKILWMEVCYEKHL